MYYVIYNETAKKVLGVTLDIETAGLLLSEAKMHTNNEAVISIQHGVLDKLYV
jgi:hypothetical protein